MITKKRLVITVVCTVMFALNAFAATYYISTTGNDANDGLSRGAPFGTFLHATEALNNDDTLVVMEGIYTNPFNRDGATDPTMNVGFKTNETLLENVTFKGDGPDKTIFRYVDGVGMNVTDIRFIKLYGVNNTLSGIKLDGDILGDGWWYPVIYAYNADDCTISNMWVEFPETITGRTAISPVWVDAVSNLLVTHCLIDGGGIGCKDFNWACNHYTTFRNLTLVNQREGGGDRGMGIVVEGNNGTIIENCVFQDNANYGIALWVPETGTATTVVQNCLWWNSGLGFLSSRQDPDNDRYTVAIESGTVNADPNLQTGPDGLPYCSPLAYADYGWKVVPEPAMAIGLILACLAFIRRK